MKNHCVMLAVCAALLFSITAQAEQIENPEYKHWAQFKPGTWATLKTVNQLGGQKTETETTCKLVSVSAQKCVLETTSPTTSIINNGKVVQQYATQKRDIPAKVTPLAAAAPALREGKADEDKAGVVAAVEDKPEEKPKEGEETIIVAGRELKCKTIEIEGKSFNRRAQTYTEGIPGKDGFNIARNETVEVKSVDSCLTKLWICDEVPGRIVKQSIKSADFATETELVKFEKK